MELLPSRSSSGSRPSCSSPLRGSGPRRLTFPLLALLGAAALIVSCDEDDPAREIDACIEESIAQGRTANWTQGIWRIDGSGERTSCQDEALDADEFSLDSKAIRVHQQGHYLFLENPELHPGFSLSGMVGDRCIHIKTTEQTSYGTIHYDLPARFLGSSSFSGEFRSSGPVGCEGKGDFSVSVRLDPVPATPSSPAPADAGVTADELCKSCKQGCTGLEAEYAKDCEDSCDKYQCKIGLDASADAPGSDADSGDAGEEAETSAPDAEADADLDAEVDAAEIDAEAGTDATDDALSDAEDDVVEDAAAEADAGPADSSGPVYVLWDGQVEIDQESVEDAAKSACSVTAGHHAGKATARTFLALLAGLVVRRRRSPR